MMISTEPYLSDSKWRTIISCQSPPYGARNVCLNAMIIVGIVLLILVLVGRLNEFSQDDKHYDRPDSWLPWYIGQVRRFGPPATPWPQLIMR